MRKFAYEALQGMMTKVLGAIVAASLAGGAVAQTIDENAAMPASFFGTFCNIPNDGELLAPHMMCIGTIQGAMMVMNMNCAIAADGRPVDKVVWKAGQTSDPLETIASKLHDFIYQDSRVQDKDMQYAIALGLQTIYPCR